MDFPTPERRNLLSGADLRFIGTQADTSLHCKTTDTGLVHRTVCLCTPQLSLLLPTEGWPGWVYLGSLDECPWTVTISVLTRLDVRYLRWYAQQCYKSQLIHSFIHSFLYCRQMSKRIRCYIWLKHITIMLLG